MTNNPRTPAAGRKSRAGISWETPFLGPMGAAGTMAGGILGLVGGTVVFNAVAGAEPQFATFAAITTLSGFGVALLGALAGWAWDALQSRADGTRRVAGATNVTKAVRPKSI